MMGAEMKQALALVLVVPVVVVLVSGFFYVSFLAWVSFLVLCLHKAQAWGWWP